MNPIRPLTVCAAVAVAAVCLAGQPLYAQTPSEYTVIAKGLNAPRGLKFGPDGELYIATGGIGGSTSTAKLCAQVVGPVGPYTGGSTGTIVKVGHDGKVARVAAGFPSTVSAGGDLSSVADVAFLDGQLYALLAGGGCSHGNASAPNGIAKVDIATGQWTMIADLSEYAMTHPGAYDNVGDFEPDGVWFNMITYGGKLAAIEPNRGIIVAVEKDGRAHEVIDISASQGHIVPTAMAEHDGDLYVGNLLYFPILPDWSRISRVSPVSYIEDDQVPGFQHSTQHYIADSKAGFTTVIAVDFGPDGLLYVLELSAAAGFPTPGMGKVVRVEADGSIQDVVTGLTVPGGMTWGPDGMLYVSDFSATPVHGLGKILRFNVAYGF